MGSSRISWKLFCWVTSVFVYCIFFSVQWPENTLVGWMIISSQRCGGLLASPLSKVQQVVRSSDVYVSVSINSDTIYQMSHLPNWGEGRMKIASSWLSTVFIAAWPTLGGDLLFLSLLLSHCESSQLLQVLPFQPGLDPWYQAGGTGPHNLLRVKLGKLNKICELL